MLDGDLIEVAEFDLPWGLLDGATVLITGAAGFLPAAMVETLLFRNARYGARTTVVTLVRNVAAATSRFRRWLDDPLFKIVYADLSAPLPTVGNVDYLIHAASQASPRYFVSDPVGTALPNVVGTYSTLELARSTGAKSYLYFSSAEIYGKTPSTSITETDYGAIDPLHPRSIYAEAKRAGEALGAAYARQFGVHFVSARPFHCYGPGMKLDDGRVFADFTRNILNHEHIKMNSDGSAVRSFCYLTDAATGFFTALLKGESAQAYNVGNPDATLSMRELAELLVVTFPDRGLGVEFGSPTTDVMKAVDKAIPSVQKLQSLGWSPAIGPAEGFRRTIRSYEMSAE